MARFLIRSIISTIVTMLLVSLLLFILVDVGSGDITVKILGIESTAEQRASYRAQLGLNAPLLQRYLDWLIGNDYRASRRVGYPLVAVSNPQTNEKEWWADVDGQLTRWALEEGRLLALRRQEDGSSTSHLVSGAWKTDENGLEYFWGLDNQNRAVKWVRGAGAEVWVRTKAGFRKEGDGPQEYIPLLKGMLRLDPGKSLEFGRPVAVTLLPRIRNTLILAGVSFAIVMPLALLLGIIAGINEGKAMDRIISIIGLGFTATPEFVIGIALILIFVIWLPSPTDPTKPFFAMPLFITADAIYENPAMLILPVLTLTLVELGYVSRMTRASMVEVMDSPYVRTAIIKGMPYRRVVVRHAIRNALMAPITIIMLHVNWLIGGIVVTEVIFGYPGLGSYIYRAAIFGDFYALEAAAMVTVLIAVITRLIGDFAYTLLNPRIRYA